MENTYDVIIIGHMVAQALCKIIHEHKVSTINNVRIKGS